MHPEVVKPPEPLTPEQAAAKRRGILMMDAEIISAMSGANTAIQTAQIAFRPCFRTDVPTFDAILNAWRQWNENSAGVERALQRAVAAHHRRAALEADLAAAPGVTQEVAGD